MQNAMLIERLRSIAVATTGIATLIREEDNAKVHLGITVFVVAAGSYFGISATEWCLILMCIGAVFSAEALNSAIESLTDLVQPDQHPIAGKTKDLAAAAVLIVAVTSVAVGLIVFCPKVVNLF